MRSDFWLFLKTRRSCSLLLFAPPGAQYVVQKMWSLQNTIPWTFLYTPWWICWSLCTHVMQMPRPQLMCTFLLCSVAFHHPRRVPSTPTECHCLCCITSAFKTLFTRPTELFYFPVHVVIRETNAKMFLVWPKPKSYKWADLGLGWWIWSHSSHEIHVWCSPTSPRIEDKIIPFKLLC